VVELGAFENKALDVVVVVVAVTVVVVTVVVSWRGVVVPCSRGQTC